MLGAFLAGLVLGAFVLAVFAVFAVNAHQTPPSSVPIYEPTERYEIGGDAR